MDSESGSGRQRLRVSDAERDAVVARLNDATGEGRLSLEEFSERVTAALAARTQGELDVLVEDLPAAGKAVAPRPAALAPVPAEHITPIGAVKRSGRWRLDRDQQFGTVLGTVKLDLRQAEFPAPAVDLRVQTVIGSVKVWVPRGVAVEVEGHTVVGTRGIVDDVPARPGAPVLRLRVDTVIGSVKVYRD
jgi:hypothetical protein